MFYHAVIAKLPTPDPLRFFIQFVSEPDTRNIPTGSLLHRINLFMRDPHSFANFIIGTALTLEESKFIS